MKWFRHKVLDQIDDVNEPQDEADAPIIVPPPNQILRRTARTKIRKPNLSGDGGGHRFPTTRRKSAGARQGSVDNIVVSPTDASSSGHSGEKEDTVPPLPTLRRPPKVDAEGEAYDGNRRLTYTEETSIFDAYADDAEDEKHISPVEAALPTARLVEPTTIHGPPQLPPVTVISEPEPFEPPQQTQQQPSSQPPVSSTVPILHQPQPQRRLSPQQQQVLEQDRQPSRTPSPDSSTAAHEIVRPDSRSSVTSEAPSHYTAASSTIAPEKRKEKDKKSIWRKVGGSSDKQSKKAAKEEKKEKEREKEKESSGFFNSIFGGKKKQEEAPPPSNLGGGAGPATAAALLGASKSKQPYSPTLSPQLGNPYARYPIHVERAVYRLSHIKLANPRRPLYEQVLISNLMFWYLGVINKANQPQGGQVQGVQGQQNATAQGALGGPQAGVQGAQGQENAQGTGGAASEREQAEREQVERERVEREERERAERERSEASQKRESGGRRGSLTKPPPAGSGGGRRAEVAVKGHNIICRARSSNRSMEEEALHQLVLALRRRRV